MRHHKLILITLVFTFVEVYTCFVLEDLSPAESCPTDYKNSYHEEIVRLVSWRRVNDLSSKIVKTILKSKKSTFFARYQCYNQVYKLWMTWIPEGAQIIENGFKLHWGVRFEERFVNDTLSCTVEDDKTALLSIQSLTNMNCTSVESLMVKIYKVDGFFILDIYNCAGNLNVGGVSLIFLNSFKYEERYKMLEEAKVEFPFEYHNTTFITNPVPSSDLMFDAVHKVDFTDQCFLDFNVSALMDDLTDLPSQPPPPTVRQFHWIPIAFLLLLVGLIGGAGAHYFYNKKKTENRFDEIVQVRPRRF